MLFDFVGLFYSMRPEKTITQQQVEGFKKNEVGTIISCSIYFAYCLFFLASDAFDSSHTANADGSETLPSFFIGHAKKPRCFERKTGKQLGFYYRSNKKT
jgi:hypothetical protein